MKKLGSSLLELLSLKKTNLVGGTEIYIGEKRRRRVQILFHFSQIFAKI